MASNNIVENRLGLMAKPKSQNPELIVAPTYHVTDIQEGTEINSFARKDAEERLPSSGAIVFYIPKSKRTDIGFIESVLKLAARATSPDDQLWDLIMHYAEENKLRWVSKTREEATAEVLLISEAKGRAIVDDETNVRLPGMYRLERGVVIVQSSGKGFVEDQILEADAQPESFGQQLPERVSFTPITSQNNYENTQIVLRGDENNMALPATETLAKVRPAVNIGPALERASKIIAFLFEEDPTDTKVLPEDLSNTIKSIEQAQDHSIEGQVTKEDLKDTQPVSNFAGSPFLGSITNPDQITILPGAIKDPDTRN